MRHTTIIHTAKLSTADQQRLLEAIPGELIAASNGYRIVHTTPLEATLIDQLRREFPFDINPLPAGFQPQQVRLLVSDMDSTFITIECIDEIADMLNIKPKVAAITEAAMRGELDFPNALRERVALLEGLPLSALERVYQERLKLTPGVEAMLAALKQRGIKTALVSGGFTFFTDRLKQRLGLDYALANQLASSDGCLNGSVSGSIVDGSAKAKWIDTLCDALEITPNQVIAVGDGANDLKMVTKAGLGIAYHAKPALEEHADVILRHSNMAGLVQLLSC